MNNVGRWQEGVCWVVPTLMMKVGIKISTDWEMDQSNEKSL